MIRNDYIMRQIEVLGNLMAKAMRQMQAGDLNEAQTIIENGCVQGLGLEWSLIRAMPVEQLSGLLRVGIEFDIARAYGVTIVLDHQALQAETGNNNDAIAYRNKAVVLLVDCYRAANTDPDFQLTCVEDLDRQLAKLAIHELEDLTAFRLIDFNEAAGRFGAAEDLLFRLAERSFSGIETRGIAFYEGLLAKEDAELEAGNLPRDEVLASLDEWKALVFNA